MSESCCSFPQASPMKSHRPAPVALIAAGREKGRNTNKNQNAFFDPTVRVFSHLFGGGRLEISYLIT